MEKIESTDLVLTLPLTYQRNTYARLTLISSLPTELQKIAKTRKIVAKYGDLGVKEKNPDYKKKYEKAQTENTRLKNENVKLRKNIEHYEGLVKEKDELLKKAKADKK